MENCLFLEKGPRVDLFYVELSKQMNGTVVWASRPVNLIDSQ